MRFAELDTSGENIFTDVSENDWFYDYVVGAIKYGWITGYSDGRFGPYDTITRAQVTTIVNRMLDRSADEAYVDRHADELEQFTDVPGHSLGLLRGRRGHQCPRLRPHQRQRRLDTALVSILNSTEERDFVPFPPYA